ncbi:MAG: hypothetical protein B7Z15_16595 [Rhizobiales bacterium 32-66-8]|nr:MAG: hypothetical protein B7Z15_16595 [Rhizobiales bacterium 32-66-8]
MAIWSVLTKEQPGDTAAMRAERTAFVREKFSWAGLIFAPLVLLRFQLWMAFAVFVALTILATVAEHMLRLPGGTSTAVTLGLHLLVALELPSLRVRKLVRNGYREVGVVVARDRDSAEHRFFSGYEPDRPHSGIVPSRPVTPSGPGAVIGAFPEPRLS